MADFTFENLESKYQNFYAPAFEIKINGDNLVKDKGMGVTGFKIVTKVTDPDSLSFSVANGFNFITGEMNWIADCLYIGKTVEASVGYTSTLTKLFMGFIKSVNVDYPSGGAPSIKVECTGYSFFLTRASYFKMWHDKKYSEVISEIAGNYTTYIKSNDVDDTSTKLSSIVHNNTNDFVFIKWVAEQINFDFYIRDDKLYFKKALEDKSPVINLKWGKSLRSFSPVIDLGGQIPKVTVTYWDKESNESKTVSVTAVNKIDSAGKSGPEILQSLLSSTAEVQKNSTISVTEAEAKSEATALLNRTAMKLVTGSGDTIGIPEIRAGKYIQLEGLGLKLNGVYFVKTATHTIGDSGYITSFELERNTI
jgi:uncharacterized protein